MCQTDSEQFKSLSNLNSPFSHLKGYLKYFSFSLTLVKKISK